MRSYFILLCLLTGFQVFPQGKNDPASTVWVPDLKNGTYKNPIIHADYSDPDVCRVGDDYYMIASSFNAVPGLPILHSKDLVNWRLIGHALKTIVPLDHFKKVQHGNGVWAPSIRFHNNEFYIYYPDPDFGIYLTKASNINGPWSEPVLVQGGKGLIDPCPLWDDNGKVYLVHAFAGSRAGIKSIIVIKELTQDGTGVSTEGVIVYDGHESDPTLEGPKIYKRNSFYYIFAPAGGVSTGWQLALRSKNIYGPYERKIVMDQGSTSINGPHQGAWITAGKDEDWFIHFQDKEAYGRVVHLQPLRWQNDWPVIGVDKDGDGKGEPVLTYRKPNVANRDGVVTPPESDEFNEINSAPQWQWQANPEPSWKMMTSDGKLRLYASKITEGVKTLWDIPNLLLQKLPAEEFVVTTKLTFKPNAKLIDERVGLILLGQRYGSLSLIHKGEEGIDLVITYCEEVGKGGETETVIASSMPSEVYLRLTVRKKAMASFSYSRDGKTFTPAGESFEAKPGKWVGAKVGLYCIGKAQSNDSGYADFDWFRVEPINEKL
jgi:beta-xylosidase